MKTDPETPINTPSWLGIGAVLAAIGASACCVGPFFAFIFRHWRGLDEHAYRNGISPSIFHHVDPVFYSARVSKTLFKALSL